MITVDLERIVVTEAIQWAKLDNRKMRSEMTTDSDVWTVKTMTSSQTLEWTMSGPCKLTRSCTHL